MKMHLFNYTTQKMYQNPFNSNAIIKIYKFRITI